MKYTKKLYYGNFTTGRIIRPKNKGVRMFTDAFLFPWYVVIFLAICSFFPGVLFADSYRFLKLQYIKFNHEGLRK